MTKCVCDDCGGDCHHPKIIPCEPSLARAAAKLQEEIETELSLPDPSAKTAKTILQGYGKCPICGSDGISRERCIGGNDTCGNGHTYLSSTSIGANS